MYLIDVKKKKKKTEERMLDGEKMIKSNDEVYLTKGSGR